MIAVPILQAAVLEFFVVLCVCVCVCVFLLLSVLWYMRSSMRLVKSSWWKGLIPACWRMKLVLAPPVGRAVLRKILKSLSVDG